MFSKSMYYTDIILILHRPVAHANCNFAIYKVVRFSKGLFRSVQQMAQELPKLLNSINAKIKNGYFCDRIVREFFSELF